MAEVKGADADGKGAGGTPNPEPTPINPEPVPEAHAGGNPSPEDSNPGAPESKAVDPVVPQEEVEDFTPIEEQDNSVVRHIQRPLPNVFSPNNDGVNDSYLPVVENGEIISIRIIELRTQSVVFESDRSQEWKGTDRFGQPAAEGSYLYIIETMDEHGAKDQASQLLRLYR